MMKSVVGSLVVAFLATQVAVASEYRKVNGSVRVAAGASVDSAGTVNGSIEIGERARVGSASTVNGSVTLGAGATVNDLETVNGSIDVGDGGQVTGGVETVNGKIHVRKGAVVAGAVENVNGSIEVDQARIKGRIDTVNANLTLGSGAQVEGGIHYRKPKPSWNLMDRVPRVVIGPGAVVGGRLVFEREVQLYVSDSATIGQVEGAKVIRFSGAQPPG